MKQTALLLALAVLMTLSCAKKETPPPAAPAAPAANPLLSDWTTPFQTPPFDIIKEDHYRPAFDAGMEAQKKEIDAVASLPEAPTFANSIEALDRSGTLLTRTANVFFALTQSNTNEAMQKIEADLAPILSKHQDDIILNAKLFERIKAVEDQRAKLALTPEQARLLERTYKTFVRNGAALDESKKAELRKVNEELAVLTQTIRPERPRRGQRLQPRPRKERGSGRPARRRRDRRGRNRQGPQARREMGLHPPQAELHPVLPVFLAPGPPGEALPGLHQPGGQRERQRQPDDPLENRRPARDAGQPPRLQDPRRLRPRRHHGQDPAGRRQAPRSDLGAGPGHGQGRGRRAPGIDEQGRHRRPAPGLGLVVLRRKAQEGQIRPRRRDAPAVFRAQGRPPGRLRHGRRSSGA